MGPKHINTVLTRNKFEELVADLVESTVEPCQKALWDAKLQPNDIDKIILVREQHVADHHENRVRII